MVLFVRSGRFGLFGKASSFPQVHFGLEDLHDFQNDRRWKRAFGFASRALAFGRWIDEILGPTIEGIGPVLGLGDGESLLLDDFLCDFPKASQGIFFADVIKNISELDHRSTFVEGFEVIDDLPDVVQGDVFSR